MEAFLPAGCFRRRARRGEPTETPEAALDATSSASSSAGSFLDVQLRVSACSSQRDPSEREALVASSTPARNVPRLSQAAPLQLRRAHASGLQVALPGRRGLKVLATTYAMSAVLPQAASGGNPLLTITVLAIRPLLKPALDLPHTVEV